MAGFPKIHFILYISIIIIMLKYCPKSVISTITFMCNGCNIIKSQLWSLAFVFHKRTLSIIVCHFRNMKKKILRITCVKSGQFYLFLYLFSPYLRGGFPGSAKQQMLGYDNKDWKGLQWKLRFSTLVFCSSDYFRFFTVITDGSFRENHNNIW